MLNKQKTTGIPLVVSSLVLGCLLSLDGTAVRVAHADPPDPPVPVKAADPVPATAPQTTPATAPPAASASDPSASPFVRGMTAYRNNDLDSARALLTEAAAADPKNGDCQAALGYLLARAGQYDDALPHLENAVTMRTFTISPTDSKLNLGKALLVHPNHTDAEAQRAVSLFEEAATASPTSEGVQMALGYGYTRTGAFDKAVAAYRQATVITPTDPLAWKDLGLTLRKTGPVADAIDALKKSADLKDSDAETWGNLGDAYMERSDSASALAAYQAGRKAAPDNIPILIRIANADVTLKQNAEAAEAYGAAADKMDASPSAINGITIASLRYDQGTAFGRSGSLDNAEIAYEKALIANPNYSEALLNSGFLMYKQGIYEGALARFKKVTEIDPMSALGWKNLAAAAYRNDDLDLELTAQRHVAALDPNSYEAHQTIVTALMQRNPTSFEGIGHFKAMAHMRPEAAGPVIGLGLLYQRQAEVASLASTKQAKYQLAMQAFQEAIKRNPRSAVAWTDLGIVRERRAEYPEAAQAYKKAIAIDPHFPNARINLARLSGAPMPMPVTTHPRAGAGHPKPVVDAHKPVKKTVAPVVAGAKPAVRHSQTATKHQTAGLPTQTVADHAR